MPTIFKITGKNSGKDVSIVISDDQGNQVNAAQIGILTHFEVKVDYAMSNTKSIVNGGQQFNEALPHGAKCTMKFVRSNSALEDMEQAYRNKSRNGIQPTYKIQYMVKNRDGSINTRSLIDCKPHNWNLGDYSPDADVVQSVDFESGDLDNNGASTGLFV